MADLTVTITEAVTINNSPRGGTNTITETGINNTVERNETIAASQTTTILNFGQAPHSSDGAIDIDLVKYLRVTNTDLTSSITIATVGTATTQHYLLRPGASFVFFAAKDIQKGVGSVSPITAETGTLTDDLSKIQARPTGEAAATIEVFVAAS